MTRKQRCLNRSYLNKMFKHTMSGLGGSIFYNRTYLRAGQVPDIGEPVDVSAAVIEGVNELMGDHSVHMGLITDVILAENNLRGTKGTDAQLRPRVTLIAKGPPSVSPERAQCFGGLTSSPPWSPHPPHRRGPAFSIHAREPCPGALLSVDAQRFV